VDICRARNNIPPASWGLPVALLYRERQKIYRARVWQSRFWDHIIRDQKDWNNHVDYIHYNPVKHGQVKSPLAWKNSSIHQYYERGYYSQDWGTVEKLQFDGDYGE
jgi:putative transposase